MINVMLGSITVYMLMQPFFNYMCPNLHSLSLPFRMGGSTRSSFQGSRGLLQDALVT